MGTIAITALLILNAAALIMIIRLFAHSIKKTQEESKCVSEGRNVYITGDKHRRFKEVVDFCRTHKTKGRDVMIILGDSGFNYYLDERDERLKKKMSKVKITFFCVRGNKECRPSHIPFYIMKKAFGGKVYYEPKYPNILFALDGEIYLFGGKKYIVIGGAHSIDKYVCLGERKPYWADEMPSKAERLAVESKLFIEKNRIYGFLTHTCPFDYLPTEMFLPGRKTTKKPKKPFFPDINHSTEVWLNKLEHRIDYIVWYCGHFHIDKNVNRIRMLYNTIQPLSMPETEK